MKIVTETCSVCGEADHSGEWKHGPDEKLLIKDGDGSFIVFLDNPDSLMPPPHVAVFADIDGGVTIDLVGACHVGDSCGIRMEAVRAMAVMVALGAAVAEARLT